MMKKALLSLMMAVVCLPVAFGQADAGRAFVTVNQESCDPYTWAPTGETYSSDTVVTYITDDTIYVLQFTRLSLVIDTADVRQFEGGCMVTFNNKNWTSEGIYFDTLPSTSGCDTVVRLSISLSGVDSISTDTTVCGSWTAPWGDVYTASRYFDTVITGTCNVEANFNLTVKTEYKNLPVTEVTAECSYLWRGMTITDTAVHSVTLLTVAQEDGIQCDSIVRLRVTAFTGAQTDTFSVVECDSYSPSWGSAITASGTYSHDTAYGTYYINPELNGACMHHEIYNVTIVTSVSNESDVVPTTVSAGCSYTWAGQTITDTATHYHLFQSVIGGCDSMAAIRVTFTGHEYDTTFAMFCGNTYNWKNSCPSLPLPGASTQYNFTHDTVVSVEVDDDATGCNTRYTLVLNFYNKKDTVSETKCDYSHTYNYSRYNSTSNTWQNASTTFTESGYYSMSADGQDSLITFVSGCKTYRTLNLTLNNPEQRYRATEIDTAVCEQFRFKLHGNWQTLRPTANQTGVVTIDTTMKVEKHGSDCYDSLVNIHLVINRNTFIERTATVCDSYTWTEFDGNTYTQSGTYNDTLDVRTDEGCLQIGRLKLTVHYSPVVDIIGEWMLSPGDSTLLVAVPTSGSDEVASYKWYVNDTLRSNTDSLQLPPVWKNTDVRLLSTSKHNCVDTNWITVTANLGVDEVETLQVNIYPNPASRYINIESAEVMASIVVYNAVGQQVMLHTVNGTGATLDLGALATGSYTLRIVGTDGSLTTRKFIVNK